jgi:glycosyltransferase involved in cell wall biosynthesis
MTARGITIVVPAFDEQDGIEGVVSRLSGLALAVPVELLVVDDGSTDGTVGVLERIAPNYPKLRVIRHDRNRGYGAALKTGFASAKHEVVVITDADGTYPENRIAELLARIDAGAEMAVGARTGPEVEVPLLRRPAKAILRLLASYLAGVRIPDLNSGLRAIRRELVKTYRPILSDGFSFTTTITLSALTNGHRVDWVSIDYKKRQGFSKIRPIRDTLGFTSLIIRTVLYFNPLKVFFPAAFVIGLALLGSLYVDVFVTSPPNLSEKTILCFVALIQVLTVGLLADLVDKRSRL